MTDELTKRRDENILKLKAGFDINNNLSIFSPWSYADGWDACQSEMQEQLDKIKKDQLLKGYVHTNGYTIVDTLKLVEERDTLKQQLEIAVGTLRFYGDEMNYTIDDYHGISGEMRRRCVLYKDVEERNDVYSYAGLRARAALAKISGEKQRD